METCENRSLGKGLKHFLSLEKQDKIWKRLRQTPPDSLGYKRGRRYNVV